jgi:hypothetical protein
LKNPTVYNDGLFEWTYFRTKPGDLYLLLIVNYILNNIELGENKVSFESVPLLDNNNLSLKFSEKSKGCSMIEGEFTIYPDEKNKE